MDCVYKQNIEKNNVNDYENLKQKGEESDETELTELAKKCKINTIENHTLCTSITENRYSRIHI